MQFHDLRTRLNSEYDRLRLVATDLEAPVPSCPAWSVDQLLRHVATVYLHKVVALQTGMKPQNWVPDFSTEPALDLLERAYTELTAEFDAREPDAPAWTWFAPDQTVGFWIRRMAHETSIHRYDAELAVGLTTPVVNDLAADGVDEALTVILTDDGDVRAIGAADLREVTDLVLPTIEVRNGARSFFVRPTLQGVFVDETGQAATTIEGVPSDLLLWLWRRADADTLKVTGDPSGVAVLSRLMETATT
jgi:uncharacterized protein (TIGR03083 family)